MQRDFVTSNINNLENHCKEVKPTADEPEKTTTKLTLRKNQTTGYKVTYILHHFTPSCWNATLGREITSPFCMGEIWKFVGSTKIAISLGVWECQTCTFTHPDPTVAAHEKSYKSGWCVCEPDSVSLESFRWMNLQRPSASPWRDMRIRP